MRLVWQKGGRSRNETQATQIILTVICPPHTPTGDRSHHDTGYSTREDFEARKRFLKRTSIIFVRLPRFPSGRHEPAIGHKCRLNGPPPVPCYLCRAGWSVAHLLHDGNGVPLSCHSTAGERAHRVTLCSP